LFLKFPLCDQVVKQEELISPGKFDIFDFGKDSMVGCFVSNVTMFILIVMYFGICLFLFDEEESSNEFSTNDFGVDVLSDTAVNFEDHSVEGKEGCQQLKDIVGISRMLNSCITHEEVSSKEQLIIFLFVFLSIVSRYHFICKHLPSNPVVFT